MKKLLFVCMIGMLVLSSCGNKQTKQELFDDYSLVGVVQNGTMKYGIQKAGKDLITTMYDTIVYDNELGVFLCSTDDSVYPVNTEGETMMYGAFRKIFKEGNWMRLETENGCYLMDRNNPKRSIGKINDYGVEGDFVFTSVDSLWGVVYKEKFIRITDISYQKVYIVNPHEVKGDSTTTMDFAIFAQSQNDEWKMYDPQEVAYKISSAEIQKMVTKAKPQKPYGILKVKDLKW